MSTREDVEQAIKYVQENASVDEYGRNHGLAAIAKAILYLAEAIKESKGLPVAYPGYDEHPIKSWFY